MNNKEKSGKEGIESGQDESKPNECNRADGMHDECKKDESKKEDISNTSAQSEINIGLVGHVDHGKTTLTKALSGIWTDKHSDEIKWGISIRLGYADCEFYKCPKCDAPDCYCTTKKCPKCGSETELLRRVSFVDAPGHETLMATMLSGAALMDGAVLVIAANEKCPQPQTAEHLMALDILGIKNIIIAQNKVDLISKEEAAKNYEEIQEFIKDSVASDALIIPIAAHYNANIDALVQAIEEKIHTPKRDMNASARMYVARSFDINRPGTGLEKIKGGVIGGSINQGTIKVGDVMEISPGVKKKNVYNPIRTKVVSLSAGTKDTNEVHAGGLIAMGTELDPSITKSDNLSGSVIGLPGTLPELRNKLKLDVTLFKDLISVKEDIKPLMKSEALMLSVGSAVTVGMVSNPKAVEITLKRPVCADIGSRVAINRRFGVRWHLIGYGIMRE